MASRRLIPVAVMLDTQGYGRQVLAGIVNYLRRGAPWLLMVHRDLSDQGLARTHSLNPRGVIAQLASVRVVETVAGYGAAVVNISGVRATPWPRVGMDNVAIGQAAGRHLVEKGYRNFACVFRDDVLYAAERERGFRAAVRGVARSYHELNRRLRPEAVSRLDREMEARTWLRSLPKLCGLFEALAPKWSPLAVRFAEVRVPDELGIVSVGDDALEAEMHAPPLTTVDYPGQRIGFEAALLLDRLMRGGRRPAGPLLLPPTGVTVRQSTDYLVSADELIVKAMDHIHNSGRRRLTAADVADQCGVSRRTLDRRFSSIGRSVGAEIRRAQAERACELLSATDLPLKQVAARSGLDSVERLCKVVRRARGTTPSRYRNHSAARALRDAGK